jgi:hypothetical protein
LTHFDYLTRLFTEAGEQELPYDDASALEQWHLAFTASTLEDSYTDWWTGAYSKGLAVLFKEQSLEVEEEVLAPR